MGADSGQVKRTPQYRRKHFQKEWSLQTSTNDFVILGTVWDKTGFEKATLQIWNTGDTNNINYKVLGSLNSVDYDIEVISTTILDKEDYDLIDISSLSEGAYIPYIQIQIESTIDDSHSTIKAFAVCV